jgi:EAL domain-containing protein (putative c-di-GMP-specific phosphodiesterase class I)
MQQVWPLPESFPVRGLWLSCTNANTADRLSRIVGGGLLSFTRHGLLFCAPLKEEDIAEAQAQTMELLWPRLTENEKRETRMAAGEVWSLLSAESILTRHWKNATRWFESAIAADQFSTYFQPIVDLQEQRIFGHECLLRLTGELQRGGAEIVDTAFLRGEVLLFDTYARVKAIRSAADHYRPGTRVFVNLQPTSIEDPEHCIWLTMDSLQQAEIEPSDLVFEIVETEATQDPEQLRSTVARFQQNGISVAIDDLGTGSSSIQLMCEIRPNYAKLDKSLIWNLRDEAIASAVRKLVKLGEEINTLIIAEGIESAEMRQQASDCGIRYMQGYWFGRPAPQMWPDADGMRELQRRLLGNSSHG